MSDKEIPELNMKNAEHYGLQLQMNHFTEELAELVQAVCEEDPEHIAEEIADVEIMVEQVEHLLPLNIEFIKFWVEVCEPDEDTLPCIWHLSAPIKSINKLRRVNLETTADPDKPKVEIQIKRQIARKIAYRCLETDIGKLVSYLSWLKERYDITAEGIRQIKSYKVQRTRDRIAREDANGKA